MKCAGTMYARKSKQDDRAVGDSLDFYWAKLPHHLGASLGVPQEPLSSAPLADAFPETHGRSTYYGCSPRAF